MLCELFLHMDEHPYRNPAAIVSFLEADNFSALPFGQGCQFDFYQKLVSVTLIIRNDKS